MKKHTFVVSDESVNSYGFAVLTAGIDTSRFEKNPVMYYMHDRERGVVGRWENIRKDGKRLLADAVFDDSTELAKQVRGQVEKGFLRSASIGIADAVTDTLNGVKTVIQCCLTEISIVDMPSNANAVKLYRKKGGFVYDLALLDDDGAFDLRAALIRLLGLSDDVSDKEIYTATQNAVQRATNVDESVENAVNLGYIDANQKDLFLRMAKATPTAFDDYIKAQKAKELDEINVLLEKALDDRKVLPMERETYKEIGVKVGAKAFTQLLFTLKTPVLLTEVIKKSNETTRGNWTLDDYRKYAPDELKNNPELYKELLAKGKGIMCEKSLDWYRKYAPEELKNNPELYKRLTGQK